MSEIHVVRSGESLSGIARSYGFADWRAIYDHQANASLREARPDPAMIHPGDRVFIPDRVETVHSATTDQRHTVTVPAPPEEGEPHLRNVTILVHGVNTTAGWFGLIEGEVNRHQDGIYVDDQNIEHNIRYGIIPFSWGDYENRNQGGYGHYAVDEVRQMFQNSWAGYDRIYQGHSAVRLKELIDAVHELGVQVNVIAHSNGTAVTCGALMLGCRLDNIIFMGSPLDCDNDRSQREIQRSLRSVDGHVTNFWSSGDEWAWIKGGIGANGNNATYRRMNPGIRNVQFFENARIRGVRITEEEVDHSDYMLAPHMPIFWSYIREWGNDPSASNVPYDQAQIDALREQANWETVHFWVERANVTMNSPEMQAYQSQIDAILR